MAELSPLRRRMIEDMTVRNMSPATQRSYINAVSKFSRYFGRSPERLDLEDVRAFQVHLVSAGTASSLRTQPAKTGLIYSGILVEILSMPDPLPSDIIARLRSDSTAALAASLILAGSFPDIVSWALRTFSRSGEPKASVPASGDDESRPALNRSAVKSDHALLAVMRANPGASLADLIRLGPRPRTSTVLSLKRLEEAGLIEHPSKGVYAAIDQALPPKSAWVAPLSGSHVARHAADGGVRDEMTMA
jgi:hypothetical protein